MTRKTYGQFCAVARSLDHIGERWTLLIVRELLVRPCRYVDLKDALPGIATNLLAQRLRDLESDGIVTRSRGLYDLTPFGRGLEPVLKHLIRWGSRFMHDRDDDILQPQWLALALDALLPKRGGGCIEIRVDDEVMHLRDGRVRLGTCTDPRAVVEGSADAILGLAAGRLSMRSVRVSGDRAFAEKAFGAPIRRRSGRSTSRPPG